MEGDFHGKSKEELLEILESLKDKTPEELAELEKQGIKPARRTITKYRKQLQIPSSRQRREF